MTQSNQLKWLEFLGVAPVPAKPKRPKKFAVIVMPMIAAAHLVAADEHDALTRRGRDPGDFDARTTRLLGRMLDQRDWRHQ